MEQKYEQAQERFVASKRELEEVRHRAVCAIADGTQVVQQLEGL